MAHKESLYQDIKTAIIVQRNASLSIGPGDILCLLKDHFAPSYPANTNTSHCGKPTPKPLQETRYSSTMRAIRSSLLIGAAVIIALCSVAPAAAARAAHIIVGGWRPIKDVNDPHIQELGGWAVSEHVRQANDGLRFGRVVSGDEQVVSGMNYMLLIEATNGAGKSATYGAAVYEQEWTKTRKLLAFAAAN